MGWNFLIVQEGLLGRWQPYPCQLRFAGHKAPRATLPGLGQDNPQGPLRFYASGVLHFKTLLLQAKFKLYTCF